MPKTGKELDWQFAQSFGTEETEEQGFIEDDVFTAVDFSSTGQYIALGDRAGRVTIFETMDDEDEEDDLDPGQFLPIEYKFYTEFQSHDKDFDRLQSVEIEETINMMRWWPTETPSGSLLLTTNDSVVKLWKIAPRKIRKKKRHKNRNPDSIRIPRPSAQPKHTIASSCKKEFKEGHGTCHIDCISINADKEIFISSDALKINMWHVEHSAQCYNILNIKPDDLSELSEVITSAVFHPTECYSLAYSTSCGAIKLCDLRDSALIEGSAKTFQSQKGVDFYSEVIETISSVQFTPCGRYFAARDYLNTKLWDVRMERAPLATWHVHEYLRDYLDELHQNECIFDKFDIASSPDGSLFVTGSYDSNFVIHNTRVFPGISPMPTKPDPSNSALHHLQTTINLKNKQQESKRPDLNPKGDEYDACETVHATSESLAGPKRKKKTNLSKKGLSGDQKKKIVARMDFAKKSLHVAWHPQLNAVAVASLNKVYIYQAADK